MENFEEEIANLKAEVAQQRTIIKALLKVCLKASTAQRGDRWRAEHTTGITFDRRSREKLDSLYNQVEKND